MHKRGGGTEKKIKSKWTPKLEPTKSSDSDSDC